MTTVFWMSRLKEGVQREAYERWLKEFDYVHSRQLDSVRSYQAHRIEGAFLQEGPFLEGQQPYDYLEVIEVTSLEDYRRDLEENPAAKAIAAEWGDYLEVADSLYGEFIPPGMIKA